jgi:Tfp pilus assembly protein PilF
MLLPAILLAALAAPTPDMTAQEPAAAPPPQEEVKSAPLSTGSTDAAIQAGLKAFRRRNFRQAEIQFRTAMDADPSNAAAVFYLAYTYYKIAEPKRPFHPEKQKAALLFAKAYELDPTFKPVWGTSAAPKG